MKAANPRPCGHDLFNVSNSRVRALGRWGIIKGEQHARYHLKRDEHGHNARSSARPCAETLRRLVKQALPDLIKRRPTLEPTHRRFSVIACAVVCRIQIR